MAAYIHPPREERIIPEEYSTFRAHEKIECKISRDKIQFLTRDSNKFLQTREVLLDYHRDERALEDEVISNGYLHVLEPNGWQYRHLSEIVEEKLNHSEHVNLGSPLSYDEMLSIILYTGSSEIFKDLRKEEITQNYSRWKVLTSTLESALYYLGQA